MSYKIVVVTAMWQRHDIFQYYLNCINRLRKSKPSNIELDFVVAGSEGNRSRSLCEANDIHYLEAPNTPLGAKLNARVRYAKHLNPDYIMGLGSDDIICDNFLYTYLPYIDKKIDFIGVTDIYKYDVTTRQMIYNRGYANHRKGETIGPSRMMSKRLLNLLEWTPWQNSLNRNLDGSLQEKLNKIEHTTAKISIKERGIFLLDIKSDINIGKFKIRKNNELINPASMGKFIPEKEAKLILNHKKTIPREVLNVFLEQIENIKKSINQLEEGLIEYKAPFHETISELKREAINFRIQKNRAEYKTMEVKKLSILIPTISKRKLSFMKLLASLVKQLNQNGLGKDVEVIHILDGGKEEKVYMSIGEKRNNLKALACGEYVISIDDDDEVHDDYIRLIYDKIKENPGIDCITFDGWISIDGAEKEEYNFGLQYKEYKYDDGVYTRPPGHLTAIRRDIAMEYKFGQFSKERDKGSDVHWSMDMVRDEAIKTSVHIPKKLYFYKLNSNKD